MDGGENAVDGLCKLVLLLPILCIESMVVLSANIAHFIYMTYK